MKTGTLIIGAGPSGLATAACLSHGGMPFELVESADTVGSAWHNHYDRLCLHTARAWSELPHMAFPSGTPQFVPRDQFIAYLEAYASRLSIQPHLHETATALQAEGDDGNWTVSTTTDVYQCQNVVIATGLNHEARTLKYSGQDNFGGTILHSRDYTNGQQWAGKSVLVMGMGNTGAEIAVDLVEHGAQCVIAVRSPVRVVPRTLLGLPSQAYAMWLDRLPVAIADAVAEPLCRAAVGDLRDYGLVAPPFGLFTQVVQSGHIPVIDTGILDMLKSGQVKIVPTIKSFTETGVVLDGGRPITVDAVIMATGYSTGLKSWVPLQFLDSKGVPRTHAPRAAAPGLFFVGFEVSLSGALRRIGRQAMQVASAIRSSR